MVAKRSSRWSRLLDWIPACAGMTLHIGARPMELRRVLVFCGVAEEQHEIVEALTGASYAVTVADDQADMPRIIAAGQWSALVADYDAVDIPHAPGARLTKSTHQRVLCQHWFGSEPGESEGVVPLFMYVSRPLDTGRMLQNLQRMQRRGYPIIEAHNYRTAKPSAEILPFDD